MVNEKSIFDDENEDEKGKKGVEKEKNELDFLREEDPQKSHALGCLIIFTLIFIAAAVLIVFNPVLLKLDFQKIINRVDNNVPLEEIKGEQEEEKTAKEEVAPESINCPGNYKQYQSESLGISFCYPEKLGETQVIKVSEEKNKIFLYDQNMDKESGQWIEVFEKMKDDSLKKAIEKEFLTGVSEDKCWVEFLIGSQVPASDGFEYSDNFIFANALQYYTREEAKQAEGFDIFQNSDNCPDGYQATNGIRYFMMDADHPDRFFFFSIGQYSIGEVGKLNWQETLEVLDKN